MHIHCALRQCKCALGWRRWKRGILLLHVSGALDEVADKDFGVGVYARDDAWRDGLGEGLVDDFANGFFF